MIQIITPNPNVPCKPGWCLAYVKDAFGTKPKYPTASAAWNASKYKHQDKNFPNGLWVPVWFTMSGEPAGHVALRAPDGSIYSSSHPTSTTPFHHPSMAALESYYGGRLGYLGWTEDVEDTLVIKGGEMPITSTQIDKGFKMMLGRPPRAEELNNPEWMASPGLFLDTLWGNGGKDLYDNRVATGDVLNFMGAVYKLDITKPEIKKEAEQMALLGWKGAMYALAAKYQATIALKGSESTSEFVKVSDIYIKKEK